MCYWPENVSLVLLCGMDTNYSDRVCFAPKKLKGQRFVREFQSRSPGFFVRYSIRFLTECCIVRQHTNY